MCNPNAIVEINIMPAVGYARSETDNHGESLASQLARLDEYGCLKIFSERLAANFPVRPQLKAALLYVRDDDLFVVTSLNRLGSNVRDILDIIKSVRDNNAHVHILDMDLRSDTPEGNLMINTFAAIVELEHTVREERRQAGRDKAASEGRYKGRTRKANLHEILLLKSEGWTTNEIALKLGCDPSSIWRALPNELKQPRESIDRKVVRRMFTRGLTASEIADEMQRSASGVTKVLRDLGLLAKPATPRAKRLPRVRIKRGMG